MHVARHPTGLLGLLPPDMLTADACRLGIRKGLRKPGWHAVQKQPDSSVRITGRTMRDASKRILQARQGTAIPYFRSPSWAQLQLQTDPLRCLPT